MLIQISEHRWIGEPEAIYRLNVHLQPMLDGTNHLTYSVDAPERWVARMPSERLEWLSNDEYKNLISGIRLADTT